MDGIIRPLGKALELGQDLIEHVERDLAVGLGLLVRVELNAVLGKSIEKSTFSGISVSFSQRACKSAAISPTEYASFLDGLTV